jgi:acetyl esterase
MFTTPLSDQAVDRFIDGPGGPIRLRTFVPEGGDAQAVMLHIHGGAWIMGAPEMNDVVNLTLSRELGIAVVSVDYRLAPEHPYPAGHDDCEAAALWLLEHAEAEYGSSRLLIGGESAGGHLAAVTLLRMRDRHHAVDRFLGANLVFGVFDLTRTPSQLGVGAGPDILDPVGMLAAGDMFVPGVALGDRRAPDLSPLYADLTGMPPALFTAGTADHLVDDTMFMAARWELSGNRAEMLLYPDAPHGCTMLPSVSEHWTPRLLDFFRTCLKD